MGQNCWMNIIIHPLSWTITTITFKKRVFLLPIFAFEREASITETNPLMCKLPYHHLGISFWWWDDVQLERSSLKVPKYLTSWRRTVLSGCRAMNYQWNKLCKSTPANMLFAQPVFKFVRELGRSPIADFFWEEGGIFIIFTENQF